MLLGSEGMEKLKDSKIAVFGLGGVGGHCCEALARCGVGSFDLFDNDTVSLSNINRQAVATGKTVGMFKTEVMCEKIKDINPLAKVNIHNMFYLPENAESVSLSGYDYVIDAIDTVSAKIELAVRCEKLGVPLISSMGTGNKLDPTKLVITDIYKTEMCPLARVMRRELKNRGVKSLKVVYSTEKALKPLPLCENTSSKKAVPGSTSFVPSVCGLIIASEVVRDIVNRSI